jgi:enoyl-[acyl-carrier protein] reductase/trans-2-enoyl-CoA reductase (NAD+)
MKIEPKIKGFLCTTAHPAGCAAEVHQQIQVVEDQGAISGAPQRVLVIGASGGYGLASRIVAAMGCGAQTMGVFFERPAKGARTASPGWYKTAAFTEEAERRGLYCKNFNGDAFSTEMKATVIKEIQADWGQVDLVVYSLAAPARTLASGETVRSTLKPIGAPFSGATIDFNSEEIRSISLDPATDQEVADTVQVMGGEDWQDWITALSHAGCLASGCITTNYTYLGSEVTWPIYYHGTIGRAKEDLDRTAARLNEQLAPLAGKAEVVVMKGLLTQAASAIPGMSLYLSLLFKAMKANGTHEGCIEQVDRLFRTQLFLKEGQRRDDEGRLRMDELEMAEEVQSYVREHWSKVSEANLHEFTDFAGYKAAFLHMHGFSVLGIDYEAEQIVDRAIPLVLLDEEAS